MEGLREPQLRQPIRHGVVHRERKVQIDGAAEQALRQRKASAVEQVDAHVRPRLVQAVEKGPQIDRQRRPRKCNPQAAVGVARKGRHGGRQGVVGLEEAPGVREQDAALLRQAERVALLRHEPGVQAVLEGVKPRAERGGSEAQLPCGCAHGSALGEHGKFIQPVKIHASSLHCSIYRITISIIIARRGRKTRN